MVRCAAEPIFQTDRLPELYSASDAVKRLCAGVLAIALSSDVRWLLIWFRAEELQIIKWAGHPHKAVEPKPGETLALARPLRLGRKPSVAAQGVGPLMKSRRRVASDSAFWRQCSFAEQRAQSSTNRDRGGKRIAHRAKAISHRRGQSSSSKQPAACVGLFEHASKELKR